MKTALGWGDLDNLSTKESVSWLINESGFDTKNLLVFNKKYHFAHVGFFLSSNMDYFKNDILKLIKN